MTLFRNSAAEGGDMLPRMKPMLISLIKVTFLPMSKNRSWKSKHP